MFRQPIFDFILPLNEPASSAPSRPHLIPQVLYALHPDFECTSHEPQQQVVIPRPSDFGFLLEECQTSATYPKSIAQLC